MQVVFGQQRLHFLREDITHGDDLQLVVDGGLHVVHGNTAAADESVFHNQFLTFV